MIENVDAGDQTFPVKDRAGVDALGRNRLGDELPALERRLSPNDFPTPQIAFRNRLTLTDVEWFAPEQAKAANLAASKLDAELTLTPRDQWPEVFKDLYLRLERWRYELAVKHGTESSGAAAPQDAQRFLDLITDDSPNVDPVGSSVGFWHKDYLWDEDQGRYVGDGETPASRLVAEVGEWATARFEQEDNSGSFLQNEVIFPDGIIINGKFTAKGTSIARGQSAYKHDREGLKRAQRRGDAPKSTQWDKINNDGGIIYLETATENERKDIREALYKYLTVLEAKHQKGTPVTIREWAEAAYLSYQSPQNKKGSDAVSRVYLMTLARRWLRPIPKMPDAIDWLAYTVGQDRFVDEIVRLNTVGK